MCYFACMNKKEADITNHMLMERIKNSDHRAFSLLFDRLWESLYTRAYTICGDRSLSKDVVQEVWINFWERRQEIENTNVESYLFQAVRFKIYNELRNMKLSRTHLKDFLSEAPLKTVNDTDHQIRYEEANRALKKDMSLLPLKSKKIVELSRLQGMTNEEIANRLGISPRTVETHLSDALKFLRTKMFFLIYYFFV